MKNKTRRMLALFLASVLITGSLSACGKGEEKKGQSSTDIEISYWQAGLGADWLKKIVAAFNEKHPEYNAYFSATADEGAATAAFGLQDADTVDLYMAAKEYDTQYLESLNDVLDATVEGETKSIKEKFDASYLAMEEKDGNYYNLTYGGGVLGFVYNKDLFEQAGIAQAPRTTDELALVCGTLIDNDIKPLVHFKISGYYSFINEVWFAQYNGIEYYRDFYATVSKEKMLEQDGRYEVLKVHEQLNTPENVLTGSNSESHVHMQTKFLEGEAAIMLNGSWLEGEMSYSGKMDQFVMMKTPVISSITDKLTTVKKDKDLRTLITAIDNVTDGVESIETYKDGDNYKIKDLSVSAADWEYVKAARNMMADNYAGETCYIPNYSNAKEGAKEFLKFLYSDEGYQIYLDTLHLRMPLSLSEGEINTSNWSSFQKNQSDLLDTMEYGVSKYIMNKDKLFIQGGADSFVNAEFVNTMCTLNDADRKNAEDIWKLITDTVGEKYEKTWMKNIQ